MKKQNYQWPEYTVGVCYYPEHWDESLWESDLERMLQTGITVIRIAEFSWNLTEPKEGVFCFDFFDRFLDLCAQKGMKVIFGTPTATPPAWLTSKYPEVLNADINSLPYEHGARRHYNYNAPIYQEKVRTIVTVLGEHYGKHPAIIGWQIDNELNCETADFHSEADQGHRLLEPNLYRLGSDPSPWPCAEQWLEPPSAARLSSVCLCKCQKLLQHAGRHSSKI